MQTTFSCVANNFSVYGVSRRWFTSALGAAVLALAGCAAPVAPPVQPPVAQVKPAPKPPRIGLALGGGAARGFAHIGVLQVLEEQGIKPDLIVGTSAGSLVATLYASGKTPTELGNLAMAMDESSITDWMFPGRSLLKGEALAKYVSGLTGGTQIENLKLPLGIVATDLNSGQPFFIRKGDPGIAVRASSCVPGVFAPVKIGAREYVDGGLVSPVPVHYAQQMGADIVIAVDISSIPEGQPTKGAIDILMQTFNIMGHTISQYELKDADVVMRPKLAGIGSTDFSQRRLSILAGREAALTVLQQLKEKIAAKTK